MTEIQCPVECAYLSSAREHPAAVVRKQQERDAAVLVPSIRHLTERQQQLFYLFHSVIARYTPEGFARLHDDDVAEASGAVASTLETASRGVIYEHSAQSPIAQGLSRAMTTMLEEVRAHGTKVYDSEVAVALRAIERGARETRKALRTDDATAYLTLVARLLHVDRRPDPGHDPASPAQSSIILP